MRKKYLCLTLVVCLVGAVCIVGCGKKKKITYGNTPGVATGTIDLSGDEAKIDVENIIAPVGSDIDYTAGIEVVGEDDDYSVKVNATNVKNDTPGTYTVGYSVTSNGKTQISNIKVTITEDESLKKEDISQNIVSSNKGETVVVNNSGSNSSNNNSSNDNSSSSNQSSADTNNNEMTTVPKFENETTKNNSSTQTPETEETTTEKILITGSNKATIKNTNLENAVIELLSGDVVTISCSTKKYIIATRTDESIIIKNGHNYSVSKLVVVFNTGEERTLETIEKKID